MNMDIVLLIIAICYPFIFKYLEQYFVQKGKNAAQKEDMRDIQYETKKGENIATKEDIEEITAQIENVKNEISFENQRRHWMEGDPYMTIQQLNRTLVENLVSYREIE